jgi:hypothetical protein
VQRIGLAEQGVHAIEEVDVLPPAVVHGARGEAILPPCAFHGREALEFREDFIVLDAPLR